MTNKTNKQLILTWMRRFYRTSKKANLIMTPHLHQVAIGCMFDLHAEKPSNNHNTRLQFKQSTIHTEYIVYLFELFRDYCGSPPLYASLYNPKLLKTYTYGKFNTLSIPCFHFYRSYFYDENGIKFVPDDIAQHFTSVSLAH